MIAAYLIRASIISGLFGLAAMLIEYAFASLGVARRFVWLAALVFAAIIPAAAAVTSISRSMLDLSTAAALSPSGNSHGTLASDALIANMTGAIAPPSSSTAMPHVAVPAWLAGFDLLLMVLWAASSILWGALLLTSAVRMRRQRSAWREATLEGMPVYLSHDTGPAVFGFARYSIVIPAWVERLEPVRRRLIVTHECEHARAGDPITLLAGALLVLVQPLNPACWMMFRRLRLAIEIDCDARVVGRHADVRTYGDLLIDVGARTIAATALMAALAEGGSQLGIRIAAMSASKRRVSRARTFSAIGLGALLGLGSWRLPQPMLDAAGARSRVELRAAVPESERAIVSIYTSALHDAAAQPEFLIWPVGGPVRYAIGADTLQVLMDTLRLDRLAAIRFDVTDGNAVMQLANGGTMSLQAEVRGGLATRLSATAKQVLLLRGGLGVTTDGGLTRETASQPGDDAVPRDVLQRLVRERFDGLLDRPVRKNTFVWLLLDRDYRVIQSNDGLPPGVTSIPLMTTRTVTRMLSAMTPQLRRGEAWGWEHLPGASGGSLNVVWMRQLYPVGTPSPDERGTAARQNAP